jgi:hypothetical protein
LDRAFVVVAVLLMYHGKMGWAVESTPVRLGEVNTRTVVAVVE